MNQSIEDRATILQDLSIAEDRRTRHQTKRALSRDRRERALLTLLLEEDDQRIAALRKKLARGPCRDGDTG